MKTSDQAVAKPVESEPKPKPRENKLLIFIAVAFVCLYVVLTAYVILSNKTIGSTQLGYSALHKEQLQLVQREMVRLSDAIAAIRQDQEATATLNGVRFDGVENRVKQVSKALEIAETSRQAVAKNTVAQLGNLHNQLGELGSALGAVKTEQGQFGSAVSGRLTELQNRLGALSNTLSAMQTQQAQTLAALAAQLNQMQKETVQIASAKANLDQVQFLGGLIDAALAKGAQWQQVSDENLPDAAKWWRQSQLLIGAANTEVALADKMRQLSAISARVRDLIVKAIPAAMRRQDDAALKATDKNQAMAAWSAGGEILTLFPVTPEASSDAAVKELAAEHDNVRQQLQARNK